MKASKHSHEREQLVRGALVQLFSLQIRSGTSKETLEKLALECANEAAVSIRSGTRKVDEIFDAQDYGSVLKTWHRDAAYLSPEGFPQALAIGGKSGLRQLIEKFYPKTQYRRVLLSLRKAGLVRERKDGKWLPTERCAVFPRLNDELLTHVSEGISRLVQTVTNNVTSQRKDVLFERSAKVRSFPADAGPAFRQFVNAQASAFLSAVDDWLESHSLPAGSRGRKRCTAGVFSFAFIDGAQAAEKVPRLSRSKK